MTPPWLVAARKLLGLFEIPGPKSHPVIMSWATKVGGWIKAFYTNDDIPWCALFVDNCLLDAGQPKRGTLAALDFKTYGQPLSVPTVGAILVFSRKGGGHVGFYEAETPPETPTEKKAYLVLGGNQSNGVTRAWVAKNRLVAIRWPRGYPVTPERVYRSVATSFSTNEA